MTDHNQFHHPLLSPPGSSDPNYLYASLLASQNGVQRPCSLQANSHDGASLYDGNSEPPFGSISPEPLPSQYGYRAVSSDISMLPGQNVPGFPSGAVYDDVQLVNNINWNPVIQPQWEPAPESSSYPPSSGTPQSFYSYPVDGTPYAPTAEAFSPPSNPFSSPNSWIPSNAESSSLDACGSECNSHGAVTYDALGLGMVNGEACFQDTEVSPKPEVGITEFTNFCPPLPFTEDQLFSSCPPSIANMNVSSYEIYDTQNSCFPSVLPENSSPPLPPPSVAKSENRDHQVEIVNNHTEHRRNKAFPSFSAISNSGGIQRSSKRQEDPTSFQNLISKFSTTSSSRSRYTPDRRKQVAQTRQRGACFKCKSWKATCRPNPVTGVCDRCSVGNLTSLCFRLDLSDCSFFRTHSALHPNSGPAKQQMDWIPSPDIIITVNVANVPGAPPIYIKCRRFHPTNDDMTIDWVRGQDNAVIKFPPVAAVHPDEVEEEIRSKARMFGKAFLYSMESNDSAESVIRILRGAFEHAEQYPDSMVNVALDVWACSRMCASERSLEGEEKLEQQPVNDPASPYYDQIPLPPTVDHQCDTVTIKWMTSLASGLLKTLFKKLSDKKREDWFEVFLTVFIMVNNVEFVYGTQKDFAYQYGKYAEPIAPQVRQRSTTWMEKWELSAKHLLYIHKTFFKSGYPFADPALVETARRLNPDASTQSLITYLVRNGESIAKSGGGGETKAEGDFNYELFWGREMFKQQH